MCVVNTFRAGVRKGPIELSEKVLTSADRVRDTLIHELCHAAAWIIDRESGGHGKIWKYWYVSNNECLVKLWSLFLKLAKFHFHD